MRRNRGFSGPDRHRVYRQVAEAREYRPGVFQSFGRRFEARQRADLIAARRRRGTHHVLNTPSFDFVLRDPFNLWLNFRRPFPWRGGKTNKQPAARPSFLLDNYSLYVFALPPHSLFLFLNYALC